MNITLKTVPKKLHAQIKEAALRNGRSINTEAIAALEREYLPTRLDARQQLQLIRETRARYPIAQPFSDAELKAAMEEGRE